MNLQETLSYLNSLQSRALGTGIAQTGSGEIAVYSSELVALGEAIELLKMIEDESN